MRCDPIVRLAPGVSEGVANEQFASLMPQLAREYPARFPKNGFSARLRNYLDVTEARRETGW